MLQGSSFPVRFKYVHMKKGKAVIHAFVIFMNRSMGKKKVSNYSYISQIQY